MRGNRTFKSLGKAMLSPVLWIFIISGMGLTVPTEKSWAQNFDGQNIGATRSKSSKNKNRTTTTETLSVRDQALRNLEAVPVGDASQTPQIMMPLKDEFRATERRSWAWQIEIAASSRKIEIPAPELVTGPASTAGLSEFPFLEVGAGASKEFSWGAVSILGRGATSMKNSDYSLPSGRSLPLRYQWIGYGIEPRISWNFSGRSSVFGSYEVSNVSFIQNSSESELAQWTQSFREQSVKLGYQYQFNENSYAMLSARNYENPFSSGYTLSLGLGTKW